MIPDSVIFVGETAFQGCRGLTNLLIGSNVTIIGGSAFSTCTNLTSIVIPNSVTNLGPYAFNCCYNLINVLIGNSVPNVGTTTFGSCSKLTSIVIPNSVTNMEYRAFSSCSNLVSVTIGTGVASIGNVAFELCFGLNGVYFMGNAPSYGSMVFSSDTNVTVYRTADATGWPPIPDLWAGRPTALWDSISITVSAGGGSVSPSGDVPAGIGSSLTLTATPDSGYKVKYWLVNGTITHAGQKTLILTNITADTTVSVVFEKNKAMPWLNLLLE